MKLADHIGYRPNSFAYEPEKFLSVLFLLNSFLMTAFNNCKMIIKLFHLKLKISFINELFRSDVIFEIILIFGIISYPVCIFLQGLYIHFQTTAYDWLLLLFLALWFFMCLIFILHSQQLNSFTTYFIYLSVSQG